MFMRHCIKMFCDFCPRHLPVLVIKGVETLNEKSTVNENGNFHGW